MEVEVTNMAKRSTSSEEWTLEAPEGWTAKQVEEGLGKRVPFGLSGLYVVKDQTGVPAGKQRWKCIAYID